MTEATRLQCAFAYHEAGHAVIAWALGCELRFVSSDANDPKCQYENPLEGEPERKIILCFAGPASQRKHGPFEDRQWGSDYAQAVEVAQDFGVSDERVGKLINKTHEFVAEHWANIERVARALIARITLQAPEIVALLGTPPAITKLTEQQKRDIVEWAQGERLVEAVRLFGSRAKGFARSHSDVDIAVTASDGNYVRFANEWQEKLSNTLGLEVKLKQYNCPIADDPGGAIATSSASSCSSEPTRSRRCGRGWQHAHT